MINSTGAASLVEAAPVFLLVLIEKSSYDRRWELNRRGCVRDFVVFVPTLNPRGADLILGMIIGLVLSLAWHVVVWAIQL